MRLRRFRYTAPLRLRSIFQRGRVEEELTEELRFHLDMKVEEGIARGLTPERALREAIRVMDGLEQRKEEMRDMRRIQWYTDFVQDTRYGFRGLGRSSGFAAFAVITLALGIGLNTAMFGVADAIILRPLPVPHPDRVLTVVTTSPNEQSGNFSWRDYLDFRSRTKTFQSLIAFLEMAPYGFSTRAGESPAMRGGELVSDNFFEGLGVRPAFGRGFQAGDFEVPGRDAVLVLGHDFWKRQFGANAAVVGTGVWINGIRFRIVGVAPEEFTGTDQFFKPDFYAPLAMWKALAPDASPDSAKSPLEDRARRDLTVKGRVEANATIGMARAEMAVIAKALASAYPEPDRNRGASVYSELQFRFQRDTSDGTLASMLCALSGMVLLVACANVASLLLSRARARSREIAVRLSIGASRSRVVRLLLTESLLLAAVGGIGGIGVAMAGVRFFASYRMPTELPMSLNARLDGRVLLASLAATLASAFLFGLAPALQTTRTNLVTSLKAGGVDLPGRPRLWGRNSLVVAQVACSLALLTATAELIHGFRGVWKGGVGYRTDGLLLTTFDTRVARFNATQSQQFYRDLMARAEAIAGVRDAALSELIPMGIVYNGESIVPEGFQMPEGRETFFIIASSVSETYLHTMRIPLVNGRDFRSTDRADAPRVAIVNEAVARHYWPNQNAIGKRFRLGDRNGPLVEIVGVAKMAKYTWISEPPTEYMYFPVEQRPRAQLTLLAGSVGSPAALAEPIRDAVKSVNPNVAIYDVRTMEDFYRMRAVAAPLMIMQTVSAMGLVGLILAVTGLYGLVAYSVSRRTREIGIRMAVGASRGEVERMVLGQGLRLVLTGTGFGLGLAFSAERGLSSLFDTRGPNLPVYGLVVPALVAVTLAAAYIPARRASLVAPARALRDE